MPSRAEELRKIEEFIKTHGVTVLEPSDEGQARRKWRLGIPVVSRGEMPKQEVASE